jgi:AAA domain
VTAADWDAGSDSISPEEYAADRLRELRGRLYPAADLGKIPPPTPLIEHWLNLASMSWLFGGWGSCKSFTALDMAGCVGTGQYWHGHATKQAPVLYLALEGGSGMRQRVAAWEDQYQTDMTGVHFLVPRTLHIVSDHAAITEIAGDLGARLIIVDTQNRATVGLEENSSIDMGRMIAALDAVVQNTGATVLTLHHVGSGSNRPRGHTSIDAAADAMIRVARDGQLVKVSNAKQKDGPAAGTLLMTMIPRMGSVVLAPEGTTMALADSERTIRSSLSNLVALNGGATHTELKRACMSQGMAEGTFNWALRRQVQRHGVMKDAGKYRLVSADPAGDTQLDGFGNPVGTS